MSDDARTMKGQPDIAVNSSRQVPYSVEAEQSVLGALLLDNRSFDNVSARLREADFYRRDHQIIWRAISTMIQRGTPCDFVTLSESLRAAEQLESVGGLSYIGSLANDTPSAANVLAYADLVRERSVLRQLVAVGQDIADLGYRPDGREPAELTDIAEQRVMSVRNNGPRGVETCFVAPDIMKSVMAKIYESQAHGTVGLTTGFPTFDIATNGLGPGDLMILAARPSMGKTSLAMNIAEHVAFERKEGVVIFSMEMSADQIGYRLLSSRSRIPLQKLRSGHLDDMAMDRLVPVVGDMEQTLLYVDEEGGLSPNSLRAKSRRLARITNLRLLIVDYIQLMQVPGQQENRTNEVSAISRSLKSLGKELGVPVIALSQLNRGLESRPEKRPRLSDLRESGGIEQDADLVVFVYRPWVYDPAADPRAAEIIIAKQRNGPLTTIPVDFIGELTRFEERSGAAV